VFVGFFILIYALYLMVQRHHRAQNTLLLLASTWFYGYWNWWFLFLILFTCINDFTAGLWIHRSQSPRRRKQVLFAAIAIDLTVLGFFKYFNFFADSAVAILGSVGLHADPITLQLILPLGISFHTFQAMGYTIDVYRGRMEPTTHFPDFCLFIAFFPQMIAGPISLAYNLLPQILRPRAIRLAQVNAGLFLLLWGYFQKMVVADNLAVVANRVFDNYHQYSGADLLIGVLAFTFQIFCDFAGYSDIARGLAKLMGFELVVNFKLPYFALNPSDFWARWHVSLSVWLREHLYIPLGGNRSPGWPTYRNLMLTMILGGLWHGASWNFVIWGFFHGSILVIYRLLGWDRDRANPWGRGPATYPAVALKMGLMFCLTMIGWVIFRARTVEQIGYILSHVGFAASPETAALAYDLLFYAGPLVLIQLFQYLRQDLLVLTKLPTLFRAPVYAWMVLWIIVFGVRESTEFIYFQF
jgi:D-alanyl-lipoteichoic acid acyltransferase DltB (MBOAT superfamily)